MLVYNFFFITQNIPPRAGVISTPHLSRPPPPSHPGAPRPIPEVHPGAPQSSSDTHPGAPRPVPSAQIKPSDLPLGRKMSLMRYCVINYLVKPCSFYLFFTFKFRSSIFSSTPFSSAPTPTTNPAHTSSSTSATASCRPPYLHWPYTGSSLSQTPTTFPLLPRIATRCS